MVDFDVKCDKGGKIWRENNFEIFKLAKFDICVNRFFSAIDSTLEGHCELLDLSLVDFGAIEMEGTSLVKKCGGLCWINAMLNFEPQKA